MAEIRDVIRAFPMASVGGFIGFQWPPTDYTAGRELEKLQIARWEIEHVFHNVELPMSGGFGSIQRRRVCDDFRFTIWLDLDLTPAINEPSKVGPQPNNTQPFLDGRLQGAPSRQFRIAIRFQCGDGSLVSPLRKSIHPITVGPLFKGLHYFCQSVLLDSVITETPVRAKKVIKCVIKGHGSAPLERWYFGTFCGAGAFPFSEDQLQGAP